MPVSEPEAEQFSTGLPVPSAADSSFVKKLPLRCPCEVSKVTMFALTCEETKNFN